MLDLINVWTPSGTFKLTLQFSEDYPNKPPTVRFVSRMFHPNSKFQTTLKAYHVLKFLSYILYLNLINHVFCWWICTWNLIIAAFLFSDLSILDSLLIIRWVCKFLQFMLMEAYAWTFCKISGVLSMMWLQFSHLSR